MAGYAGESANRASNYFQSDRFSSVSWPALDMMMIS